MKIKLTELAKKLGMTFDEAHQLKLDKLVAGEYKGSGRNTWLTPEAAEKLRLAMEIPAVVPTVLDAKVLHDAPNPNWVYAIIQDVNGKRPVAIPRRLRGKLVGKPIKVHAITDATGTTYRHASLTGHHY
jgi:hypothetical protein